MMSLSGATGILITLIMRAYYNHFYCVLQFSDDLTVVNAGKYGNYRLSGDAKLGAQDASKYDLCGGIMINTWTDPRATFEMFEEFIQKQSQVRFHHRRYIVNFNATQGTEFEEFFKSPRLKYVTDVLIIKQLEEDGDEFELYTHEYAEDGGGTKILLDEWNLKTREFKFNMSLFPDKTRNFQGRHLIVGGDKYLPITDPVNLKGPETELLVHYANMRNATIIFDRTFDYLGVYKSNWNGTGYIGMLLEDNIDIIAYAVYIEAERSLYGDFTRPLCEIRVTCLVPLPRTLDKWMVSKIFTYDVWFLVAINLLVVAIIFEVLQIFFTQFKEGRAHKHKLDYLNAYRFFIAQSSNLLAHTHVERFLFSILLLGYIVIQTFFNSKLSSYIAVPTYIDDINTVQDLATSDIFWYSKFNDKGKIISAEKTEPLVSVHKKFRLLEDSVDSIKDARFAYAVDEAFSSHFYTIDDYFTMEKLQNFKVMKEYIIGHQYTAFFMRRNSVFFQSINDLCYKAVEYGFVKYWQTVSISNPTERKIQEYLGLARRSYVPSRATMLQLRFFTSIFLIWAAGLAMGTIVFIIERWKCTRAALNPKCALFLFNKQ